MSTRAKRYFVNTAETSSPPSSHAVILPFCTEAGAVLEVIALVSHVEAF